MQAQGSKNIDRLYVSNKILFNSDKCKVSFCRKTRCASTRQTESDFVEQSQIKHEAAVAVAAKETMRPYQEHRKRICSLNKRQLRGTSLAWRDLPCKVPTPFTTLG